MLAPAIERITRSHRHAPRAVTADRGYGEAAVEDRPHEPRRALRRGDPRKGKPNAARREFEHRRAFRDMVKWRTGCEGRINHIKRSYGLDRTRTRRASPAPEPGADTAYSPTTSSRSALSQHKVTSPPLAAPCEQPSGNAIIDQRVFRSK